MPLVALFILMLQISCAVHAVRTGRDTRWLYLLLLFPGIGCCVYILAEIVPAMRHSRVLRTGVSRLAKTIDPGREIRRLTEQLDICESVHNRAALAEEYVRCGQYTEAIQLYTRSLEGVYKDDSRLLHGLAQAYFGQGDYAEAHGVLSHLLEKHPALQYKGAHLLLARTLEGLGATAEALHEYAMLAERYRGAEATCRYGLLLQKLGHTDAARDIFTQMLKRHARGSRYARKMQQEWVDIAKRQLA